MASACAASTTTVTVGALTHWSKAFGPALAALDADRGAVAGATGSALRPACEQLAGAAAGAGRWQPFPEPSLQADLVRFEAASQDAAADCLARGSATGPDGAGRQSMEEQLAAAARQYDTFTAELPHVLSAAYRGGATGS